MHNSTFRISIATCFFVAAFFLVSLGSYGQVKKVFAPRYDETIKGDVTIIANNMLSAHPTNNFNATGDNQDNNNRVYVDIDSDPSTFNSSSATLNDPNPGLNCKEFVKAYLYWAASDKEAGGVSQNADSWNHNQVKLMLPGSSNYTTVTADEVLYRGRDEHFHNDPYICVKDITSDVVGLSDPFGKYQVGNVQATYGGLEPHGGGNYGVAGGWQIVFVYQSTELLTRNITLFDGYAHVDNGATTDFNVDGFLSIPTGPVKADIILGSIEGDRVLSGDSFQILKPDGNWQKISTPLRGQDNFFSSTISLDGAHFTSRVPASTNTLGYDASIFELSNPGNTLIANNQTSTTLRATSGQESYGLYLVGFSIEVYEPSLGALEFTTSPANSTYDPGETATLSMSIENSGNDNIRNLEISTVLPIEVNFNSTEPLPDGVTYTFDGPTRELKFFVEDGYIDTGDSFDIDFNVDVLEQCYFLETACSASFSIQATATFNGEINTTTQTTSSSGTLDECGFGNHDPSIVEIEQPDEVDWETGNNDLNVTVACDDTTALNDAQALEPTTEFCDFTLNKVSGAFVPDPDCESEGTYTNTWTFTDACGRVSDTFTQVITLVDTTAPNFNEALPVDTIAAYDNIPTPEILTASDSCDSNPQVTFEEDYDGDETSTTYTIIRTWTAEDCAGNTTEHTQKIFVTENGDPIGLAINDISVDEDEGTATFTVTHTGEVPAGFTVNFASADGTAIALNDYTAYSDALSFSGDHGETKTIDVSIIDDIIVEEQEEYTMTLTTGTNTPAINRAIGTGTIVDNDAATISIADIDVNEAVGNATIVVTLTGSVEEAFDIDFTTADGSAEAGTDYTTITSQINWPANATSGSTQNILVPINNDDLIEFTENFLVDLTNILASSNITFDDNQANVNILDNDAGVGTGLSFDATSVTVDEAAGVATFTVTLTGDVQGGFTVDYATADGSAGEPGDYTSTFGTLTFVGTNGESFDIDVPIIDDVIIEAAEVFSIGLSNVSHSAININTPSATGTIIDNDSEDDFPSDTTMQCEEIPVLDDIIYIGEGEINLNASGCEYIQDYSEVITGQDDECATEYTITRTWTITDCVNNVRTHTQIITVLDTTAPIFVESLPADMTVSCDAVPTPAGMTAMDNCDADASVTFTEIITGQDDECASEYTITRTWVAQDCAGNSTSHTQTIIVEDVIAPTFVEALPSDITVVCSEVPVAATMTAIDNCDPNIVVTFEETITNDANCAMGYTITRTWMANDCAGNATAHTQVITIPATGPITASDYDEEVMITCGEDIPEVPNITFMGGCGDYTVVFTEETQFSGETDDYMIIRTWEVTDACNNMETFEQIIFVMQPQLETVAIDICVEDPSIDLVNYLPASFDTNGTFEIMTSGMVLNGSVLDPIMVPVGEYQIAYSSTEGTCKYYVDFTITVNADCVPCGIDDIIPSKTVTPNGDGVNDLFEIRGVEFCNFNFDVMLFNRWGAKVYEAQNYQNDWGGSSPSNSFGNSGMLPAGTYYYIIKVTNKDFEPVSGYIYLGSN